MLWVAQCEGRNATLSAMAQCCAEVPQWLLGHSASQWLVNSEGGCVKKKQATSGGHVVQLQPCIQSLVASRMQSVEVAIRIDDSAGSCYENTYIRSAPSSLFPQPFDEDAARGVALQTFLGKLIHPLWGDLASAKPWVCVGCGKTPSSLATKFNFHTPAGDSPHVMSISIKSAPTCPNVACLRGAEKTPFPEFEADKERGAKSVKTCNFCGIWDTAPTTLKKCSNCKAVSYCSKACQKQDWPKHKTACITTPPSA